MGFEQRIPTCLRLCTAAFVALCLSTSGRVLSASEQGQQAPPTPPRLAQAAPAPPQVAPGAARSVLRIGSDEAVRMALENNLGIQTERLNPQLQALATSRAMSAYTPELFGGTTRNADSAPPTDFLQQGVSVATTTFFTANGGIRQQLPWGGRYSVGLTGTRFTSDAPRTSFSPRLNSDLDLGYTQPLLRGFKIDAFRQNVLQSKNQQQITDIQLAQRITQTSRNVRHAYFNLVAAISGLQVAQQSLDVARQSYKNNQRRVEVGTMAQIDIIQAEAEVARQEETVIVRQGQIDTAEDGLRALIMNPSQPDFWTTKIEPAEQPVLTPAPIDVEAAVRNALANRTDLAQLKKQIESVDLDIKFNQNQKMPALDVSAAYGLTGVGGTQISYGDPLEPGGLPPILATSQRGFGSVLRDVFGNEFRNWTVGFSVSYPLGTSVADAALAQSRLQRQQSLVSQQQLEMQITTAVREAARDVTTNLKRVEATKKARELAQRRFEADEKRLAVGLGDTFQMLQAQRDLANALQVELNAIIDYNRALIDFEAVQTVPLGGGF
jgi:outer membrane protein TolC